MRSQDRQGSRQWLVLFVDGTDGTERIRRSVRRETRDVMCSQWFSRIAAFDIAQQTVKARNFVQDKRHILVRNQPPVLRDQRGDHSET
jgi:hypothetical protein